MSTVKYQDPFDSFSGSWGTDHTCIFRQKRHVLGGDYHHGAKEAFHRHHRDYKRAPMTAAEQAQTNRFSEAAAYLRSWWNKDKEQLQQNPHYQYWHERWLAQAKNPDPRYKVDKDGYARPYVDFRAFVRAMYMRGERVPSEYLITNYR